MPEYLTASEVAAQLRVSVETVNRWCRTRQLYAVRAGRGWRIQRGDLNVFLNRSGADEEKQPNALAPAR